MPGRIASPDNTSCDNGQFSDTFAVLVRLSAGKTETERGTILQERRMQQKGIGKGGRKIVY
jgi:hypothetical protein